MNEADFRTFISALQFAADKHRAQKRKSADQTPYINHLIDVTETLVKGGVSDMTLLTAAVLHDAVEDQQVPLTEISQRFGQAVADLVAEVTDDKSLAKATRKQLQIENAQHKSVAAKQLKIADKISNIRDVAHAPATDWSQERRMQYLQWAEEVVAGCRGVNSGLDKLFDEALSEGRTRLSEADTDNQHGSL